MSARDRKSRTEMLAEHLREIGTLVLVFGPLEELLRPEAITQENLLLAGAALALGLLVLVLGMVIELQR